MTTKGFAPIRAQDEVEPDPQIGYLIRDARAALARYQEAKND